MDTEPSVKIQPQVKQSAHEEQREKQLNTLRSIDDYYAQEGSWYAVIAGWAREAHLHKRQPHKDIDIVVPKTPVVPYTKVGVDFIRMEGNPKEGLWIPAVSPYLIKFYIPPIAAESVRVEVDGVSFQTLRPEALLLMMIGGEGKIPIPSWTPHFGNKQPSEKFANGWRDLQEIANPTLIQQMTDAGFGFYIANRRVEWPLKLLKKLVTK